MASRAHGKIVAAERPLTVVATGATERIGPRVMIQRRRRGHLPASRDTRPNAVAARATQFLRGVMVGMTETNAKRARLLGSADQTAELMTRAARSDVTSVCLRVRRVTSEARDVRVQARGNRKRHAAAVGPVTSAASRGGVFRVIESRVETA